MSHILNTPNFTDEMKKDYNRDVMSDMPMEASFVAPVKKQQQKPQQQNLKLAQLVHKNEQQNLQQANLQHQSRQQVNRLQQVQKRNRQQNLPKQKQTNQS